MMFLTVAVITGFIPTVFNGIFVYSKALRDAIGMVRNYVVSATVLL